MLPVQASSVPCERLFSASKRDADQLRARIGPLRFEQTQVLKYRWRKEGIDFAKNNGAIREVVTIGEYEAMLANDDDMAAIDRILVPRPL